MQLMPDDTAKKVHRSRGLAPFNVLVVYQDFAGGQRAAQLCRNLSKRFDQSHQFHLDLWKFELLGVPEFQKTAADQARMADLIVVAGRSEAPLPHEVQDWMELWMNDAACHSRALVALLDRDPETSCSSSPAISALSAAARNRGIPFFCCGDDARNQGCRSRAGSEQAVPMPPK